MPKFYAVAFESGTSRIFSNWDEAERVIRGRSDVRFKKFKDDTSARVWGAALAEWLKKRSGTREILKIEQDFERAIEQSDPRLHTLS